MNSRERVLAHLAGQRVDWLPLMPITMQFACDLRGINTLMLDFYDDPPFVRDLFEFAVEMELRFARAQVEAGADLIGVGDAAASLVGPAIYEEFVWSASSLPCRDNDAMRTRLRTSL